MSDLYILLSLLRKESRTWLAEQSALLATVLKVFLNAENKVFSVAAYEIEVSGH